MKFNLIPNGTRPDSPGMVMSFFRQAIIPTVTDVSEYLMEYRKIKRDARLGG
jgi:hypothetical protein